ncbi:hypothetical protein FOA43_003593 [Brettanomyces nanus]|uniref:RING-type E3 ubiquitin transferase n=1 Tax=Eeniella nana TaxID=13502 RepID=A0A875RWB4_EENNA|nr:uncharacterized protein FOA43_003593 [Brettanomyces nanus]QPG76207.1 hypothetical protein FOA43_003593 [Brettanomyces nanus]
MVSGLRKVLLLDGIVSWFTEHRAELIGKVKKADHVSRDPHTDEANDIIDLTDEHFHKYNQQELEVKSRRISDSPKEPDTLVECPVCSRFMTTHELQSSHLDICLRGETIDDSQISTESSPATGMISSFFNSPRKKRKKMQDPSHQLQPKQVSERQRIPNLDTMMSTVKLREKLAGFNLPTGGTRQQMEARMKEYINLYNANLDSISPVDEVVLVNRLHKWELLLTQSQHRLAEKKREEEEQRRQGDDESDEEVKREATRKSKREMREWRQKYRSTYHNLIQKAKNNMKDSAKPEPTDK